MTTLKQLTRKLKKRSPKAWAKVQKEWDYKMIGPVTDFIVDIGDKIYGKVPEGKALYNGPAIEEELWKLLEKVRRITQLEK